MTKFPSSARSRNSNSGENDSGVASSRAPAHASFNAATTTRSLQDFVWLEQALRAEYHGAMLVPLLSLAVYFGSTTAGAGGIGEDGASTASRSLVSEGTLKGMPRDANLTSQSIVFLGEKMDRNEIVDTAILSNWLSDVVNGVRGNGELLLYSRVDVVESEAIETFLFRHSEPLRGISPSKMGMQCRSSNLGSPFNLFSFFASDKEDGCNKSLFDNFMESPFACFGGREAACTSFRKGSKQIPLSMLCSSGATGVPGIKSCSSNLSQASAVEDEFIGFQVGSSIIATHSELLEAERDLIASYIKSSSIAMIKVQALMKDEAYVGQCWKRLAICLSNLFSVEKDLETAHIGDQIKSNKKNQPFRKLKKNAVDDGLRILARSKIDRAIPSLQKLRAMLNAYYSDLNSVVPAFKEYTDAISHLHQINDLSSIQGSERNRTNKSDEWQSPLEQLRFLTLNVAKQIAGTSTVEVTTRAATESDSHTDDDVYSLNTTQSKALQKRVLSNEKTMKISITLLCKACPLRNARMAWWYLKLEAKQASNVHAASTALRQTLSIDADTAIAMKERRYDEDEMTDNDTEVEVVKRILELGSNKNDPYADNVVDLEIRRQNALRMAKERVGRWDAQTALAVMEAAGVDDAEVQMDETSRELRHVRKYAISLRENVMRCREAAEAIADTFVFNSESNVQIGQARRQFWAAISTVFSGKIVSDDGSSPGHGIGTPSTRVLSSVGIDTSDRGGWLGHIGGDENSPHVS